MALEFLSPYQASKLLTGVLPGNQPIRDNWLQSFFSDERTTERDTVNLDVEFDIKNVMGMYVQHDVDTTPIMLEDFGHKELSFAYSKEGLNSPDYEEISTRRLGQPLGELDVMQNEVLDIRAKLARAEQRFENLFELNAANIIFFGQHTAVSEKHPKVFYDFGRKVVTDDTEFQKGYIPSVNLTTLNSNGGVGKQAWGSTGGTVTPSPVKHLKTMLMTARRQIANANTVVMAHDAYDLFEADLTTNYKDAANLTLSVDRRFELKILPMVERYQALNYQRSVNFGSGAVVDIFTYDGIYHDRITGAETKYVPNGYVAVLPPSQYGIKVYGRIKHPRANYAAMPRWLNFWENQKTGKREWEIHTNYLMAHSRINSLVSWKVK